MKAKTLFSLLGLLLLFGCEATQTIDDIEEPEVVINSDDIDQPYTGSIYDITQSVIYTETPARETITIETTDIEWELTGNITVDYYTYIESTKQKEHICSYAYSSYNSSDTDNIPYPLTNLTAAATYGSFKDGGIDTEIVGVYYTSVANITKSSATDLSITVNAQQYSEVLRVVNIEVLLEDGSTSDIQISQYCDAETSFCGFYPDPVWRDTSTVTFSNEGGSYAVSTLSYDWLFPDLTCIYDNTSYLYDTLGYSGYAYYSAGLYPPYIDGSYTSECTYNELDNSRIEKINGGYYTIQRVEGSAGNDISITLEPNDSGEERRVVINLIPYSSESLSAVDRSSILIIQNS